MKYLLDGEESSRLLFRNIYESDYNDWLPFHKDPSSNEHWNAELQSPELECKKWYEKQFHRYKNDLGGHNALIDKTTKQLIGHCGLLVQTVDEEKVLEIGYSLLPQFRGMGFATEAAKKCRDYAFDNSFADQLISIISLSNLPSQNVAKKNGMTVLKQTVYHSNDVYIYSIQKSEWSRILGKN